MGYVTDIKHRVYPSYNLFFFFFFFLIITHFLFLYIGFLYTSDYFHSRIYLTQYIAPLQADFNPSLNDSARILIYNHSKDYMMCLVIVKISL